MTEFIDYMYSGRIAEVEDRLHAAERRYATLGQKKSFSDGAFGTSWWLFSIEFDVQSL